MTRPETYISTDIETDGPIPGPHSMLAFASVAFDEHGVELSSFANNLETLPGASGHADTMRWWEGQQEAWNACRQNPVPIARAMTEYVAWVNELPGRPVFVAYPAGFDFLFMYWYMIRFTGESPFGFSALDIKTYSMAVLGQRFRDSTKRNMPRRWFSDAPHTHVALDDAREQGRLFVSMLRENSARVESINPQS